MAPGHELRASIVKPLSTVVHLERYKDAETTKTKTESCNPQQSFISVEKVKQTTLIFCSAQKRKALTQNGERGQSRKIVCGVSARHDLMFNFFLFKETINTQEYLTYLNN